MSASNVSQNRTVVHSIGQGMYLSEGNEQYTWHEVLAARKHLVVIQQNGQRLSAKQLERAFKALQARRRRNSSATPRKRTSDLYLGGYASTTQQATQRGRAMGELVKQANADIPQPTATVACELMTETVLWYELDNTRFEPSQPVHRDEWVAQCGLTTLLHQEPHFGNDYQLYQYC